MGALVSTVNILRAAGPEVNKELCVSKMCVFNSGSVLEL